MTVPASGLAILSSTCSKYGGVNIPVSTGTAASAKAGSAGAGAHFAMPTGVAAAVAVVGAVGAML
jgi:hypothetical protein